MSIKDRLRQLEDKVDRIERCISKKAFFTPEMAKAFSETPIKEYISSLKEPKPETPEIIQNVMRWQGKDYLVADFVPGGSYKGTLTIADLENNTGKSWVPFEKVEITDALARMRTDDQPIWVMVKYERNNNSAILLRLVAVCDTYFKYKAIDNDNIVDGYHFCRLATVDDLKKAGIR